MKRYHSPPVSWGGEGEPNPENKVILQQGTFQNSKTGTLLLEVMNKKKSWASPLGWLGVTWHVIVITPGSHNPSLTNRQVRYRSDQVNLGPKKVYGTVFEIISMLIWDICGFRWFLSFLRKWKLCFGALFHWSTLSMVGIVLLWHVKFIAYPGYRGEWILLREDDWRCWNLSPIVQRKLFPLTRGKIR